MFTNWCQNLDLSISGKQSDLTHESEMQVVVTSKVVPVSPVSPPYQQDFHVAFESAIAGLSFSQFLATPGWFYWYVLGHCHVAGFIHFFSLKRVLHAAAEPTHKPVWPWWLLNHVYLMWYNVLEMQGGIKCRCVLTHPSPEKTVQMIFYREFEQLFCYGMNLSVFWKLILRSNMSIY